MCNLCNANERASSMAQIVISSVRRFPGGGKGLSAVLVTASFTLAGCGASPEGSGSPSGSVPSAVDDVGQPLLEYGNTVLWTGPVPVCFDSGGTAADVQRVKDALK